MATAIITWMIVSHIIMWLGIIYELFRRKVKVYKPLKGDE